MPMNLNKNLENRKVGAKKALDRIRYETGIDKDKLIWVDSLNIYEPKYRLRVFAGDGQKDFVFTDVNLSSYAKDQPVAAHTIEAIIHWIKDRTSQIR